MDTFIEHIVEPGKLLLAWQAPDHMSNRRRWAVATVDVASDVWLLRYFSQEEFSAANGGALLSDLLKLGFEGYPAFARKTRRFEFDSGVREAFMRRLPPRSRTDFADYVRRFGFKDAENISDAALLAYTEAKLPSDGFSLVGELERSLLVGDLILDVAGTRYQDFGDCCPARPGDLLTLRKEPTNDHDPSAIEIYWQKVKIGYVNRMQAPTVGYWMDHRDIHLIVQRVNGRTGSPKVYALLRVRPAKHQLAA